MADKMTTIERALALWVKLTGFEPERYQVQRAGEWSLRQMGEEIREALDLDPSNATGAMLLSFFTRTYLDEKGWSANDILGNYDKVMTYLKEAHELYQLLGHDDIVGPCREFKERLLLTLRQYGLASREVVAVVEDADRLTFLRRDALKSMEKLQLYQFLQGKPERVAARYAETVYGFWNVNSLVKTMAAQPGGGISLALIKTPEGYHSYFVYVIRNGGTLSVLTDRPHWRHPLQAEMQLSRGRADRDFFRRAAQNWFPYQFCNYEVLRDEEGAYAGMFFKEEHGLVPYQNQLYPVGRLADMEPAQIVWNVLMLDLINDKFWKKDFKAAQLAYTGEMVKVQNALIDAPEAKALAVTNYRPLTAPPLTAADVVHDKVLADWDTAPSGRKRWLEERYKGRIGSDILNVMWADRRQVAYVTPETTELQTTTRRQFDEKHVPFWERDKVKRYDMQALDPTFFGTEEEIHKNQRWVARHNMAKLVQREADAEFAKRKGEVEAWFRKAAEKNLASLCGRAKRESIEGMHVFASSGGERIYDGFKNEAIYVSEDRCIRQIQPYRNCGMFDQGYRGYGKVGHLCYFDGTLASHVIHFHPTTEQGLAILCGCRVDELPDVLQVWDDKDDYRGNALLNSVDPMDWILQNPWCELDLTVTVYLSKRAFGRL